MQQRLDNINLELKQWYSDNPGRFTSRLPKITLKNLTENGKASGWAKLSGQLIKAANSRHAMPFVEALAKRYLVGPGSENSLENKSIVKVCEDTNTMYRIMYSAGFFLSVAQKAELRTTALHLGKHWMAASSHAALRGDLQFQMTPKVHITQHVPDQADLINPRYVQNYRYESLVGRVAAMWAASATGPYEDSIQKTVLLKYLVVLANIFDW